MMTPAMRKFVLTAHITSSVGWLGAVAAFLALSIAGLTSPDTQRVRAAYLAMDMTWVVCHRSPEFRFVSHRPDKLTG